MSDTEQKSVWQRGDPLQVWKWPALAFIGLWTYLGSPGTAANASGRAVGVILGSALVFAFATMAFRKMNSDPNLPWWVFAVCCTAAGVLSIFGIALGNGLSAFSMAYLFLLALAWVVYTGAGAVGLVGTSTGAAE